MSLAFIDVPRTATLAAARQRVHKAVLGRPGRRAPDHDEGQNVRPSDVSS